MPSLCLGMALHMLPGAHRAPTPKRWGSETLMRGYGRCVAVLTAGFDMGAPVPVAEPDWSAAHKGLCLYLSRLLQVGRAGEVCGGKAQVLQACALVLASAYMDAAVACPWRRRLYALRLSVVPSTPLFPSPPLFFTALLLVWCRACGRSWWYPPPAGLRGCSSAGYP